MTNMEKIQICQEIVNRIQLESRRPVCYLRLIREPFTITDSHLGGVPYVPHDLFTFPAGDSGDIELSLNGGTLNFVIRPEDLKKRDFSQVLAQWACT